MAKTLRGKCACFYCGKEYVDTNYYNSISEFFINTKKVPYCKQCIKKLFEHFVERYTNEGCEDPDKKAVRRLCMAFDINFNEKAYDEAISDAKRRKLNISAMNTYMKRAQLLPHKNRTYDDTISDEEEVKYVAIELGDTVEEEKPEIDIDTKNFFGNGFNDEDYRFLKKEYDDWTARHECKTKAQEEVFKRICFKQLEILKATRSGEDTKDLDLTFQKLLETAKLQPKQNSGDAMSDAQTFGTLIDKWENERPLPEIDEELRDVDKIGFYLDTFFKGHTCKMLNVKNAFSNLYSSMMKKFTVSKPEYNLDEDDYDSEINFDTIFGDQSSDYPNE